MATEDEDVLTQDLQVSHITRGEDVMKENKSIERDTRDLEIDMIDQDQKKEAMSIGTEGVAYQNSVSVEEKDRE